MCAPLAAPRKPKQRTLRPAVSKKPDVGALTDRRSLEILDNTAWKMLAGIRRAGEQSADALLEARRRGRAEHELPGRMELVFEALGAVAYDMEWTRGPELGTRFLRPKPAGTGSTPFASKARAEWYACRYVFELMLCVDYGVAIYPLLGVKGLPKSGFIRELSELERCSRILTGVALAWSLGEAIPSSEVWDHIARVVGSWESVAEGVPVWDIATMLYYYNAHSKPVDAEYREQGWTGYTGVLSQMISEVPTRGKARLERKLSLDVHLLIPTVVRDRERRVQMMFTAQSLAVQHGCQLPSFKVPKMRETLAWRRWFNFLAGRLLSRKWLGDDENGGEKEELIGGKGEGY